VMYLVRSLSLGPGITASSPVPHADVRGAFHARTSS
jgi:hypothetical protein